MITSKRSNSLFLTVVGGLVAAGAAIGVALFEFRQHSSQLAGDPAVAPDAGVPDVAIMPALLWAWCALAVAAIGTALLFLALRRRQRSDMVLQGAINSVHQGIAAFAGGQLVGWNRPFADLLGIPEGKLRAGMTTAALESLDRETPDALLGELVREADGARASGRPVTIERRRPDGSIFEIVCSPHLEDGFVLTVADVTRRRRAEDYLRHAQKMEALGQMTGGIAHDFNNFLTVVILNLDYIQQDSQLTAKYERRLQLALESAFRGAKVARQLLAFARKQPLEQEIVVLAELMPDLGELARRAVGEAIEVEITAPLDLWPTLVDPVQFESAILNLALNSAAAMNGSGRLTIALANVVLDDAVGLRHPGVAPGEYVHVAVGDTGIGMPPEIAARAFEPFFTTKPGGQGSGLGLSMVYGFVKQTGGHIEIDSEPGRGTTVNLYFLRSTEGAAARPGAPPAPPDRGSETILVVEDDESLRATVMGTLKELGYRVLGAPNGAAALVLLESTPHIDLLFSDLVMPGPVTATMLVDAAKEMQPGIRVLFTSGYAEDAVGQPGRLAADVAFLNKPYRKKQLADGIKKALAAPRDGAPPPARASERSLTAG